MIKVCHLTSVHSPTDVRILYKEAVSLAAAGYEVTLIAPGYADSEHEGVRVLAAFPPTFGRLGRMTVGGYRVYRKALSCRARIYHFHDPELMPWALFLHWKGMTVIYDAHEDLPIQILGKHYLPALIRRPLASLVRRIQQSICSQFEAVVTATEAIAKTFETRASRVEVIRNLPLPAEFVQGEQAPKLENQVCYIGGIFRMRGIVELMQSLPLAGVRLALAGSYSPASLREELSQMPEWKYVDEKGLIDRKEIASLLSASKAGMVTLLPAPNFIESLPVKMFEYMAAGIPVIASDFPLWKEIIEGNDCGLCVNPESPDEIAAAIRFLTEHPDRASEMGNNGRNAIRDRLNWQNESQKLLALYADILEHKNLKMGQNASP